MANWSARVAFDIRDDRSQRKFNVEVCRITTYSTANLLHLDQDLL